MSYSIIKKLKELKIGKGLVPETLHENWSFPLRISSVNVTKSAVFCGFSHIYWRNPQWKLHFLCNEIAKKKGKVLATDISESVPVFYEDDQSSRNCPGKKEFVSVRINGEKVHKQKHLLLVNLKGFHKEFKNSCNKDLSFSRLCELRPTRCIPVGSASSAHSVCVCQINQNVKLMANVITSIKDYKELLETIVCNNITGKACCTQCDQNPGAVALKENLNPYLMNVKRNT